MDPGGVRERFLDWLFLEGDRRLIAFGIVVVFVGVFSGLVWAGVIAVGAGSSVASVFGSGLTAGVVTLVTIALSINQLILSRVFGSPGKLTDRLEGSRNLCERVERLADQPSSPNDPGAFLSLLAVTLNERATAAQSMAKGTDADTPTAVTDALSDFAEYGRSIDSHIHPETPITDVLGVIIGTGYAENMTAVRHLRNEYGESLPEDVQSEFRAIGELMESIAVVRQFFKTLALQQDFATLSRQLIYTGLVALLVSVSLTLVYRTDSVTIASSAPEVVVPLALGAVLAPLGLFAAYLLRAATVAYRTVSVGPFVPPEEQ